MERRFDNTILGDLGTANLDDRMLEVKVYYVIEKSPWARLHKTSNCVLAEVGHLRIRYGYTYVCRMVALSTQVNFCFQYVITYELS